MSRWHYDAGKKCHFRATSECCRAALKTIVMDHKQRPVDDKKRAEILRHMQTSKKWLRYLTYREQCTKCLMLPAKAVLEVRYA